MYKRKNNNAQSHALAVIKMDVFISRSHLIGRLMDTAMILHIELYKMKAILD